MGLVEPNLSSESACLKAATCATHPQCSQPTRDPIKTIWILAVIDSLSFISKVGRFKLLAIGEIKEFPLNAIQDLRDLAIVLA
jgi:hypothetical protein